MQAEFGGEIRYGTWSQDARVPRSPSPIRVEILPLAAVGVIHPSVENKVPGAPLNRRQRHLRQERYRIVVELPPAYRIELPEQAGGIVIPAPPQIARQRPEALLNGSDKTIERSSFAHHGRELGRRFHQHSDFILLKNSRHYGLNDQNTLQHASIDERHAEERLIGLFAGLAEVFESWMVLHLFDGDRLHLLGHQPRQTLLDSHAQSAYTLGPQAERRC